jgi:hypothetical protein
MQRVFDGMVEPKGAGMRKVGLAVVLAAAVVAGSAFGSGLLSAGAATTSTTTSPSDQAPRGHHCRHGQDQGGQSNSSVGSAAQT